jgi:ribosomal subunit interface protein
MHTSGSQNTVQGNADAAIGPDIVVRGRHAEVTERFRRHVIGKLDGLDRFDHKLFRLDVELSEEHNPRLADFCERIEITAYSRGPVIRAEAAGPDAYAALDSAVAKIEERLRRGADRRHSRGSRVAKAHAVEARVRVDPDVDSALAVPPGGGGDRSSEMRLADGDLPDTSGDRELAADGPFVVREKTHAAAAMSLDEALSRMELVGHDFYLFEDAATGCPSVVYRRRAYHYGVLRLRTESDPAQSASNGMSDLPGRPFGAA